MTLVLCLILVTKARLTIPAVKSVTCVVSRMTATYLCAKGIYVCSSKNGLIAYTVHNVVTTASANTPASTSARGSRSRNTTLNAILSTA